VRNLFLAICFILFVGLFQNASAQSGVGNTTSTPVAGVPHDYITGLNEIVNPANGALSIRIPQPVPLERGQNWPSYAFLYDSNGGMTLRPQWITSNTNPTVTALLLCNMELEESLVARAQSSVRRIT
jgi:hypothetical protein